MAKNKDSNIEVTSDQLLHELQEIKERIGALENVAGIVNQDDLENYFKEVLDTDSKRNIMKALRQPLTRQELQDKFNYKTPQALNYHLNALREGLVHVTYSEDGVQRFEWSLLFKRLRKARADLILEGK